MKQYDFNIFVALSLDATKKKNLFETVMFYIALVAFITLLSIISGVLCAQFMNALEAINWMRSLNGCVTALLATRFVMGKQLPAYHYLWIIIAAMLSAQGQEIIGLLYVAYLGWYPPILNAKK